MPNEYAELVIDPSVSPQRLAELVLPLALGSLYHTMFYASLTGHPRGEGIAGLVEEQIAIIERITRSGLIPFAASDPLDVRMNWMNMRAETMSKADPLIARYYELHVMRLDYLPRRN